MHPTLFELPVSGRIFALDAHGLCVTLGALAGLLLALRLGRGARLGAPEPRELRDLGLELLLVGVLGARLLFVLTALPAYAEPCRAAIDSGQGALSACARPLWLWEGGLDFYGGLVAALGWLAWRTRARHESMFVVADLFAPGLALAQAIASIGCLLAGCCYGRFAGGGWGLRFPDESVAFQQLFERGVIGPGAEATPPLVPVQLYAAAGAALLCGLLVLYRRHARRAGLVFAAYLAGHALLRLVLAPLRADGYGVSFVSGLSLQQLISIATLLAACVVASLAARPRRAME